MKKNTMMRIASFLLIAVIITSCAVSGTFAKYVSEVNGTATASVAQWKFTGEDIDLSAKTIKFDLFKTINDTGNTADETDVVDDKIAPGTAGEFTIDLTNDSEVNATYAVAFEVTKNTLGLPIEYKVGEGEWKNTLDPVSATDIAMGDSVSVAVEWRWAFANTAGDEADTADGIAAVSSEGELEVTATVTLTQVD